MIRFNNDYCHGAHPSVLEAISRTNDRSYPGYGLDDWCEQAADSIRSHLGGTDADIRFLTSGTQANCILIDHALRPWQSVISADTAHINTHETGGCEHIGHKIETIANTEGKISASQVEQIAKDYRESAVAEHITQPKMVFLASPTEVGTIYKLNELEAMREVCNRYDMYLFMDGARMGYGLGSHACDYTLADLARIADAFWIGGTKCGALFGEAMVLVNPELRSCFRASIKQGGGLLAKGWLLGLQFHTLFQEGLYFDICKKADEQAMRLKQGFIDAGIPLSVDSPTNQQFVILTEKQADTLAEKYVYELEGRLEDGRRIARFCTSWSTTDAEIDELIADLQKEATDIA